MKENTEKIDVLYKQNQNDVFGHSDPSGGSSIQKREDYKKGLASGLILPILLGFLAKYVFVKKTKRIVPKDLLIQV